MIFQNPIKSWILKLPTAIFAHLSNTKDMLWWESAQKCWIQNYWEKIFSLAYSEIQAIFWQGDSKCGDYTIAKFYVHVFVNTSKMWEIFFHAISVLPKSFCQYRAGCKKNPTIFGDKISHKCDQLVEISFEPHEKTYWMS